MNAYLQGVEDKGSFLNVMAAMNTLRQRVETEMPDGFTYPTAPIVQIWDGMTALSFAMRDAVAQVLGTMGAPADAANEREIREVYSIFQDATAANVRYAAAIKGAQASKNPIVAFPDTRFKASLINTLRLGAPVARVLDDYADQVAEMHKEWALLAAPLQRISDALDALKRGAAAVLNKLNNLFPWGKVIIGGIVLVGVASWAGSRK